jgi:hypothetical protein
MAKAIDKAITGLENTWEGYKGKRVEDHLMKKIGYFYRPVQREKDNAYHLKGFASKEAYNLWASFINKTEEEIKAAGYTKEYIESLVLVDASLGGNTDIINSAELHTNSDQNIIVSVEESIILQLRFTSQTFNPVTNKTVDTGESGLLTIQKRENDNADWETCGTLSIPSIPAEKVNDWTDVDITKLLPNGTWQVRCYVVGKTTNYTTSSIHFNKVVKTKLELSSATQWWVPMTSNVMNLAYYIRGSVAKTLHLRITGEGGPGIRELEIPLGLSVYTETPRNIIVTDTSTDLTKVVTPGIHKVEAWLSVNDSSIESKHIHSQVMIVDPNNLESSTIFIVNNIPEIIDNYTQTILFNYSAYNPKAPITRFTISITDHSGNKVYFTSKEEVKNGEKKSYNNMFEIESSEPIILAKLHIKDENDRNLIEPLELKIDNSQNFAPTSNADFILNPKVRSNNESNPKEFINAATDNKVETKINNVNFITDGWINNEEGIKVLRLFANSSIDINYEPFTQFLDIGNQTSSLTMEFDVKIKNILDEDEPILRVCSYQNNLPLGFELKPLEAVFMTTALQNKRDQDIMFQEEERTHIAVNIIHNLDNTGVNYIRLFVNGVINREMIYKSNDIFVGNVNGVKTSQGIRIGSKGADIDVYGIRIYKRSLSASDIQQDYVASLADIVDKKRFKEANDILGDDGTIAYSKAYDKYSTILWTGAIPYYLNTIKQNGDVKIHIVDRTYNTNTNKWEYTVDKAHSGEMKDVQLKGQGTSSMGYYKWNGQFKTSYINGAGEEVKTNWIDENGVEHGAVYQLDDAIPEATKLVWKINWASSQQSHKLGSCGLYTDLWRKIVGGNSITKYKDEHNKYPYSNVRVSVMQKPFLLFNRDTENSEPVFYGLVTFGPGKGDKPTFGYNKKLFPDFCMIEGSDNGKPLTEHRVPWMLDEVTYNESAEAYYYNGEKSWGFDLGNRAMVEKYFVPAFNFIFLHNTNIKPFVGTYEQFIQSNPDTNIQYWVTATSAKGRPYNLYRYNYITKTWVNASITKSGNNYVELNLAEQLSLTPTGNNWQAINDTFIKNRIIDFKEHIGDFFNITDLLFTASFCKLIGASDNRCKNTYIYCDPITHKLGFMQDDLDTIFSTDNVGRKTKPYYVEEHDKDNNGLTYWNGVENVLYNTLEQAMSDELISSMFNILQAMKELGKGSLEKCINKYYFSVQEYFPATAYNETAKLLYEKASQVYGTKYTNATRPITQSLGDQLQGEKQWIKRRLIYISSYASFGEFNAKDSASGEGALSFRSILNTNGNTPSYNFTLTPALWLYPSVAVGTTSFYGRDRVSAGKPYLIRNLNADGNTNIYIRGINYYKSIGEFGSVSLGEAFNLTGNKLVEFSAIKEGGAIQFRPNSMTVDTKFLRKLVIRDAITLKGELNLTKLTKAEIIDLRGTSLSSVILPETPTLKEVYLPETLVSLTVENVPNLQILRFENIKNLTSLTLGDNIGEHINSYNIVQQLIENNITLSKLEVKNISWSRPQKLAVMYLTKIPQVIINGKLTEVQGTITFEDKQILLNKFGDIDSPTNELYISYRHLLINSIKLEGATYLDKVRDYKLPIIVNPTTGNNFKKIEWSISSQSYAVINSKTGIISVNKVGLEELAPIATVTVKITLLDNNVLVQTREVKFHSHTPQLGDIVFADGTVSDINDTTKTPVGIYFYKDEHTRLMMSLGNITNTSWGLNTIAVPNIILASGKDAYTIPNITTKSSYSNGNTSDSYYLNPDGSFKTFASRHAFSDLGNIRITPQLWDIYQSYYSTLGYQVNDFIPAGLYNTICIIAHRNDVLTDANINLPIPMSSSDKTEWENLTKLKEEIIVKSGQHADTFYFPAASYCYAYEPKVKEGEVLLDKFKAHNWWLPSIGELSRIIFYKCHGNTSTTDPNAIFTKAYKQGVIPWFVEDAKFGSTDMGPRSCYSFILYTIDGTLNVGNGNKDSIKGVMAVTSF